MSSMRSDAQNCRTDGEGCDGHPADPESTIAAILSTLLASRSYFVGHGATPPMNCGSLRRPHCLRTVPAQATVARWLRRRAGRHELAHDVARAILPRVGGG